MCGWILVFKVDLSVGFIFQKTQDVPLSNGEALRKFTRLYERVQVVYVKLSTTEYFYSFSQADF